ncbi:CD225/dispanin family protein [Streptomyces collinus]|uniref:CD225/dispanin family protein n=1 Tax=Streptomyces collinus TaxID=42684 RepID=UPI0033D99FD4
MMGERTRAESGCSATGGRRYARTAVSMNGTWTCGNCGSEEPVGTRWCSRCGNAIRPDYNGGWPPPSSPVARSQPSTAELQPPAAASQPPTMPSEPPRRPPGHQPKGHLVWAIVSLILFWPLGIPALYFAAQVKSKYAGGDYAGALDSSAKARLFSLLATIICAVCFVIAIIIVIVVLKNLPSEPDYGPGY